jgi:hypothetical protein
VRNVALVATPIIVPRAILLWGLTRLLIAVLPLAIGLPFGSVPPPPAGVVLLAGFVGLADVRVRGERILWANLGASRLLLYALYAAAAIPAEVALAIVLGVVRLGVVR